MAGPKFFIHLQETERTTRFFVPLPGVSTRKKFRKASIFMLWSHPMGRSSLHLGSRAWCIQCPLSSRNSEGTHDWIRVATPAHWTTRAMFDDTTASGESRKMVTTLEPCPPARILWALRQLRKGWVQLPPVHVVRRARSRWIDPLPRSWPSSHLSLKTRPRVLLLWRPRCMLARGQSPQSAYWWKSPTLPWAGSWPMMQFDQWAAIC